MFTTSFVAAISSGFFNLLIAVGGKGAKEGGRFTNKRVRTQSSGYTFAPVDFVPKRRSADTCRSMIDDAEMRQSAYRPPNVGSYSSESEKQRLSEVFTHKGGSALPKELTHPVGPAPFEVRQSELHLPVQTAWQAGAARVRCEQRGVNREV